MVRQDQEGDDVLRERQDDEVARKGQGGEVARQDQVDGPVHTQEQEEEGEIVRRQELEDKGAEEELLPTERQKKTSMRLSAIDEGVVRSREVIGEEVRSQEEQEERVSPLEGEEEEENRKCCVCPTANSLQLLLGTT